MRVYKDHETVYNFTLGTMKNSRGTMIDSIYLRSCQVLESTRGSYVLTRGIDSNNG